MLVGRTRRQRWRALEQAQSGWVPVFACGETGMTTVWMDGQRVALYAPRKCIRTVSRNIIVWRLMALLSFSARARVIPP